MAATEITAAVGRRRDPRLPPGPEGRGLQALGLVRNALAVMAGKTATMAFGFLFWLLAAREFARPEVGLAAGVVAAMMLCTQLAIGGVGSAVITCYAEYRRRPAKLLDTSFTFVAGSALAAAGVFLVLASFGLRHLGVVSAHPLYALVFALMTLFGTVGILLDQISIALGRGDQVLVRGLAFGAVTVAGVGLLPLLLGRDDSFAIVAPWAIAGGVNVGLGLVQLRRMVPGYRFRGRVDRVTAAELVRHGFPNYGLTLAERAPGLVLPIVVTEILTPAGNATWYAAWMMAWVVYTIPISAGLSLFAEGSNRPALLREAAADAVRVALLVGVALSLVLGVFAHFALSLLGSRYGATGTEPLRILLLAFVPLTFVQAYFATSRARRRLGEAVLVGSISAALSIGAAAAAGALWGLTGMALSWLAVQTATGAWAVWREPAAWQSLLAAARRQVGRVPVVHAVARLVPMRVALRQEAGPVAAAGVAVLLWIASLHSTPLERMNGLGLVSVLPASFYAAVVLLTLAFVTTLLRGHLREPALLALVLLLVAMLFGLSPLLEDVPRFAVTWRHVGIAQAIIDTGHVNPRVDAYFNWPGFFVLTGAIAKLAGFSSTLPLAAWSPVYLNLAYLLPLLLILRTLTSDARLVWLSVWVFYLGNWIGQDYFSPQGLSFFLYLLIVAILLRWFVNRPGQEAPAPRTRRRLLACVLFLFFALVPSHQLTPVAVLISTTALVFGAARRLWWLPPLMATSIAGWWATGARTFFKGHLQTVLDHAGKVDAVVSQNVTSRVAGDAQHRIVTDAILLAGAAMWLLAFLGAWQALRRSRRYRPAALLALAPIPLLILQTYGGEMLLRVQLFALPFTAFFAAYLFVGDEAQPRISAARRVLVTATCLVLSALFLVTRYGNERFNYFTRGEAVAVEHLYSVAAPGSILVAGTGNLPWKYRDYESHRYRTVVGMPGWRLTLQPSADFAPVVEDVQQTLRSSHPRGFLIVGRSEEEQADQLGYGTPGSLARFRTAVAASPRFRVVFRNADATIFTLAGSNRPRAEQRGQR
jgi:O-antigen/teichoic acid export membrane protein